MSVRWAFRVVLALALLSCSSFLRDARADTRTVLFIVQRPSPFSARLEAEIEAMGFEIVRAEAFAEAAPAPAVAAVRVIEMPPPRRVELWLAEGASGKLSLSTVVQPAEKDDEASQAVRASEQLRAFFQPLREPNPEASAERERGTGIRASRRRAREPNAKSAPVPPSVPRAVPEAPFGTAPASPKPAAPKRAPETPARRPPARTSSESERVPRQRRFEAAASVAVPLGTGGPGLDASLNARWLLTSRLGVGLALTVPLVKSTLDSGVNSAKVSAALAGAELSVALFDSRALRLTAIGGVALAWIRTEGDATPPYTSESDDAWAALPLLGAELAPRFSERLYASLAARAGLAAPKPDIEFAGEHVATWGQPLVLLSAGIGVDF